MKKINKISSAALWMIFITIYLLTKIYSKDSSNAFEFSFKSISILALYFLFLVSFVEFLYFLFKSKPLVAKIFISSFVVLYGFLGFYHYKADLAFDFAIIADHWKFLWRPGSFKESTALISSTFSFPQYFWIVVGGVTAWRLVSLDFSRRPQGHKWQRGMLWLLPLIFSFGLLVFAVREPLDEFSLFTQSIIYREMPFKTAFQRKYKPEDTNKYPLVRKFVAHHGSSEKPNVFIVFIESFNANFVESKAPNGKEYTPLYNSWIRKGLYFENFYGQSIQTGRAHFASLCGLTSGIYGKEFDEFANRNFHCLPQILKENGYFTVFSKANEDIHFDNTFNFTTQHGFDVMNSMGKGCSKEDAGSCWGWGIPDRLFYQRAFGFLKKQKAGKPIFAALATISSHMPFNEVPLSERRIYPDPKDRKERYSNAIRITDEYLKTFFDEFEKSDFKNNSIVILTGDHSYPMGEHKNFRNESYAYEENFKTPMLILDFRKQPVVKPGRVKDPYSQLNVASTVLDLAGISSETHFLGDSLLGPAPEFISMMQPYGGIYFAVVKYPFKYVMYDRTGEEFIYDLSMDPGEQKNLRDEWKDMAALEAFRYEVGRSWFTFDLMVQDRVWPETNGLGKSAAKPVEGRSLAL